MTTENPVGRVNYEPNSWCAEFDAEPGPASRPTSASRASPSRWAARSAGCGPSASPTTTARRGQFYVSQIGGRAAPHRGRVRVRAQQGRTGRHPRAHGRQPPQRRRGPRRHRRRRARHGDGPDTLASRRAHPITDLPPSAGAEHPGQRARLASPGARSASSSPTAPIARCCAASNARPRPRARSSS